MNKLLVLSKRDIEEHLSIEDAVTAVEQTYSLNSAKEVNLFNTVFYDFELGKADLDIKSGTIDKTGVFGFKLMTWFGDNKNKGLNPLQGNIMLYDRNTGCPIALMDATHITGMRTGAAGGVGTKFLAREDSDELLIIGSGNQAGFQLAATLMLMKNIKRVTIYDVYAEKAVEFSKTIKDRLFNEFLSKFKNNKELYDRVAERYNTEFVPVTNIENATKSADIIITVTPSRKPIIKREWVKKGTHLTCIGADMKGKQEIDENLFPIARVFIDDIEKTSQVGEMEKAINDGIFSKEEIVCEIGNVILGKNKGRISDEEITIFDASGLASQDLITAKVLYDKANDLGIGKFIEI